LGRAPVPASRSPHRPPPAWVPARKSARALQLRTAATRDRSAVPSKTW
jgi:hypothetical protein